MVQKDTDVVAQGYKYISIIGDNGTYFKDNNTYFVSCLERVEDMKGYMKIRWASTFSLPLWIMMHCQFRSFRSIFMKMTIYQFLQKTFVDVWRLYGFHLFFVEVSLIQWNYARSVQCQCASFSYCNSLRDHLSTCQIHSHIAKTDGIYPEGIQTLKQSLRSWEGQ